MTRRFLRPSPIALAAAALLAAPAFAAPGASSAYRTDPQQSHVEDATSKGISQVNMITCFMSSMRPDALVNQGAYVALVDKKKCDPEARSDTSNSSSDNAGASAPSYMNSIVESTRASNSDPMRVKTWIDESERDFSVTIYVNTSASEAPTSTNPYGVFRLDFCGRATGFDACLMNGFLEGSTSGISYYEREMGDGGSNTTALKLVANSTDDGAGALQRSEQGQQVAYRFAYDASLFRRADDNSDQCFSRLADDPDTGMSVWRYGLYDAGSGERVTLRSGFPIEFSANGKTWNGNVGYYGLWLPPEAAEQAGNGSTVQRVEYQPDAEPTKTPYTLVKADGRLTKYTKKTRTLASADKLRFNTWIAEPTGFFAGAEGNRQYELYWDDAAGAFKATATMECNENGCQTRNLEAEQAVAPSYFVPQGGVRGWSQSLGGEVFIPLPSGSVDSSSVQVVYRVQDLVYPAQMPAALYCLRDCPTATTMQAFFAEGSSAMSPFAASTFNRWQPTGADGIVQYTTDANAALLRDATGAAVSFTDSEALQMRPQFRWGVRTGRLFTSAADAACADNPSLYCDNRVDQLEVYYQWETGPNQWNQFAAVKDGSGAIVSFDAPMQVSYSVPNGAQYGSYAGKSIVLQYGGFGELWGIPGHCVSRLTNEQVSCEGGDNRYVPAFVIPFDEVAGRVTSGNASYLVKWLDREIRFARKDLSVCQAAGVTLPSQLALPDASGLANPSDPASPIYIGAKPTVSAAPRVIDGDVKF